MAPGFLASFLTDAHQADTLSLAIRCGTMVELEPGLQREAPPAIALPDEFARVTRTQWETSFAQERSRLTPGISDHGPTRAYAIDDAVLFRGHLVQLGSLHAGGRKPRLQARLWPRYENVPAAMLGTNSVIDTYFGHWLTDGLPLELLAPELGVPAVTYGSNAWPHVAGYRQITGLHPRNLAAARFGRLWLVDDRGLNAGRIRRMEQVRARIRAAAAQPPAGSSRSNRVFLGRGQLGARRDLVNQAEVIAALDRAGFTVLDPEASSPEAIAKCLAQAEIVVAVEGSAQSHYLMSGPPRGMLLTIQPPERFNAIFKTYCDAVGMTWGYVVADPAADGAFSLPIDRLLRTLELMERG